MRLSWNKVRTRILKLEHGMVFNEAFCSTLHRSRSSTSRTPTALPRCGIFSSCSMSWPSTGSSATAMRAARTLSPVHLRNVIHAPRHRVHRPQSGSEHEDRRRVPAGLHRPSPFRLGGKGCRQGPRQPGGRMEGSPCCPGVSGPVWNAVVGPRGRCLRSDMRPESCSR